MAMRHKHIAHDENPYQQYVGTAVITRTPDGRTLAAANVSATGIIAVDAAPGRAMRDLFTAVAERVTEALTAFTASLAKVPLGELLALPEVDLTAPSDADAHSSRLRPPMPGPR